MRKLSILIVAILMQACSNTPERASRIELTTLDDGRVVEMYVFGYSVEEFLCEFERGESCRHGVVSR